jgi:hypothetical protein
MKVNMMKSFVFAAMLVLVAASCRDKDMEKRIAELEAEVSELKGKKTEAPVATTTTATAVTPGVETTPTPETAVPAANKKPDGPLPVAQFSTVEHDFGTITEGESVEHTYLVKNTGTAPLIIQKAEPSCGCTVPDWSKQPIPPGGNGFVKAKFDSSGKPGIQNKSITVTANTYPVQTVLRFKAMVTPKATDAEGPTE